MKNINSAFYLLLISPFAYSVDEVIVITADRIAVSELESAYSTEVIYEDQLFKQGFRTTVDAIGSLSGVLLQKTAHGQGSPYIRGFTGFRNLFLIDGVRLNNSTFREGPNQYWNTVDPQSISRFEVVKGSTSVTYGSDAIGGTVNAITRIQSIEDVSSEQSARLFYRGSTAEQSSQIRASYDARISDNSVFSVGATGKKFGNLIAGDSTDEQPNTGYDEYNIDIKWLHTLNNDWQLNAAYFKTKQDDVPRTHKTIFSKSFAGTQLGNELKRDLDQLHELSYLKLATTQLGHFADSADFTLSYQKQQETRERLRSQDRYDTQGVTVKTVGITSHFYKLFNQHELIYGVEYYHDDVDSFSSKNPIQGPVADDSSYQWYGFYLQDKYSFNEQSTIDIGIRWNYMSVDANKIRDPLTGNMTQLDESWKDLVGNIRYNYQITPKQHSAYLGISQGFRAPNLSDLTRFDSARSNEFETPSLNLDSEHYLSFDTGIKYRSERFDYDLALYYTDIQDQIQRVPTGKQNDEGEFEITKMNLGDGYAYGGEFDLRYQLHTQVNLTASIAYIEGKVDTFPTSEQILTREYMSRLMPTNARVGLQYTPESNNWWLNTELVAFAKADRLSTRDKSDKQRIPPGGTPSFTVWNLSSGYVISEQLLFSLQLNNILDENYRIHGSGQNEAGRNIIGSISYNF
ncbi:MAG: TonB-dependent receptor [Colwellia sp.]|nr:TonB-dependent receptor [Colwellia sp.]MCW9082688.1 TonB-dependent receptor [Colwellia sp.]